MDVKYFLGLDTSVYSGSVALFADGELLCSIDSGVSRSENLLTQVQSVFDKTGIDPKGVDTVVVVVSLGPGSFTGIRIGIATALGFSKALGATCGGVSVADAMAADSGNAGNICVVPLGRRQYLVDANFSESTLAPDTRNSEILDELELIERISEMRGWTFIVPMPGSCDDPELISTLRDIPNVSFCKASIAELICRSVINGGRTRELLPIYAQR